MQQQSKASRPAAANSASALASPAPHHGVPANGISRPVGIAGARSRRRRKGQDSS